VQSPLRILHDEIIAPGAPWSGSLRRGQIFEITDLHGQQAVDFLCYNAADPQERYSAPNTLKAAGRLGLTLDHVLYSDLANPMLTIVGDSFGGHDTIGGCCSAASNLMLYGVKDCPGCRENFLTGLARFGLGRRDIVPNVNFFMRVAIAADGAAAIAPAASPPGSRVQVAASMDLLIALSNCPQVHNPANGYAPSEIRIAIAETVVRPAGGDGS
jgi:urea carboxylase-associated protein 1